MPENTPMDSSPPGTIAPGASGAPSDSASGTASGIPSDAPTSSDSRAAGGARYARLLARIAPLVCLAGVIAGGAAIIGALRLVFDGPLLDVGVFRDAGHAFTGAYPLYSEDFPSRSGFRFIYPPFAALLFAPLTWVSEFVMDLLWTLATIAAVFGIMTMAVKRLNLPRTWLWAVGLTGLALALEPVRSNMMYGQINIFLAWMIVADVLGFTPKKIRGIGIGIAAGIKITPAAYAVAFLARKDWIGLLNSVGFFFLTVAVGFAVRFRESLYFWTEEFFRSDRGGPPEYPRNQALTGLIARAGVDSDTAASIMTIGFPVIAALTLFIVWKLVHAGRPVDAFAVIVLGISLANPVAVTHHWSPIIVVLALAFLPMNRWIQVFSVLVLIANYLGLYNVYPEQNHYSFQLGQYLVGNLQGLTGLLLFLAYLVLAVRLPKTSATAVSPDSPSVSSPVPSSRKVVSH